jgi:hypothetical protein
MLRHRCPMRQDGQYDLGLRSAATTSEPRTQAVQQISKPLSGESRSASLIASPKMSSFCRLLYRNWNRAATAHRRRSVRRSAAAVGYGVTGRAGSGSSLARMLLSRIARGQVMLRRERPQGPLATQDAGRRIGMRLRYCA